MQDENHAFMPYPAHPVVHALSGPLSGMTFAVKDLFDVAGYPTGGGNPHILARSGIKQRTAPVVQTLLDNGARFIGKTHTSELAYSMSGHNVHYGTPRNGAAPNHIPGGSSSGSASAVSNAVCDFALGTDTGGSVRTPASYCGLFGLRPTHGRLSLDGCQPLCATMDTCGFFARTPEVFRAVADCLLDSSPPAVTAVKLVSHDALFARQPLRSQQAWLPVCQRLGRFFGAIAPLNAPLPDSEAIYLAFRQIQGYEAWQAQGEIIERDGLQLGPDVRERFLWGKAVTPAQYDAACQQREAFSAWWQAQLGDAVLVLPTVPDGAPLLTAQADEIESTRRLAHDLLLISVMTRRPQVTLPVAQVGGLPLGLSFLGPRGSDRLLVELAVAFAQGDKDEQ
ncbi:amidase [Raoultella sp. BIGb0138]|uniref:amidase n=1 Tax=Raoultella sp. BIGb0138 TaxID=2485115 RepID=UPI001044EEDB|nr:amidase [Raoultella sp. BIGb0138]TCW15363.1 amidase [Raoultella sp. BIGb0138]